jgi:hypothetical protein
VHKPCRNSVVFGFQCHCVISLRLLFKNFPLISLLTIRQYQSQCRTGGFAYRLHRDFNNGNSDTNGSARNSAYSHAQAAIQTRAKQEKSQRASLSFGKNGWGAEYHWVFHCPVSSLNALVRAVVRTLI